MSAVTASIIVGSRHRKDPGIQPRWLVLLHEGQNYAWHLLRLQLTGVPGPPGPDLPPGVLWRSSGGEHLLEELSLMLQLFATHTPEVTESVTHCPTLKKQRVDLDALEGRERGDFENALRIASAHGRELYLAATIHRGSRLTEEALLAMPDWELDIAHTDVTRHWTGLNGFTVTDFRQLGGDVDEVSYEDWVDGLDDLVDAEVLDDDAFAPRGHDDTSREDASEPSGSGPTHLELAGGDLRPARRGWRRRQAKEELDWPPRRDEADSIAGSVTARDRTGLADFFGFTDDQR